jgi:predicted nuclease of predicted toxin-antitoxin system
VKFIVDEQLPPAVADWLRANGHEAWHIHELGLGAAPDTSIWDRAVALDAVIVTKDQDFEARRRVAAGPQILWVRIGNATRRVVLAHIDAAWSLVAERLRKGEPVVELS